MCYLAVTSDYSPFVHSGVMSSWLQLLHLTRVTTVDYSWLQLLHLTTVTTVATFDYSYYSYYSWLQLLQLTTVTTVHYIYYSWLHYYSWLQLTTVTTVDYIYYSYYSYTSHRGCIVDHDCDFLCVKLCEWRAVAPEGSAPPNSFVVPPSCSHLDVTLSRVLSQVKAAFGS